VPANAGNLFSTLEMIAATNQTGSKAQLAADLVGLVFWSAQ